MSAVKGLTERQRQVLSHIKQVLVSTGSAPTQSEIARHFEMSPQGARNHVLALRRKGYLAPSSKCEAIQLAGLRR